jgi:hypothetical protein
VRSTRPRRPHRVHRDFPAVLTCGVSSLSKRAGTSRLPVAFPQLFPRPPGPSQPFNDLPLLNNRENGLCREWMYTHFSVTFHAKPESIIAMCRLLLDGQVCSRHWESSHFMGDYCELTLETNRFPLTYIRNTWLRLNKRVNSYTIVSYLRTLAVAQTPVSSEMSSLC